MNKIFEFELEGFRFVALRFDKKPNEQGYYTAYGRLIGEEGSYNATLRFLPKHERDLEEAIKEDWLDYEVYIDKTK
jgi:hypothetical protein